MINVDLITNKIKKIYNLNFQKVLIHLYISLVISGSGSGKTNVLLNLINLILRISVIETFFWNIQMIWMIYTETFPTR